MLQNALFLLKKCENHLALGDSPPASHFNFVLRIPRPMHFNRSLVFGACKKKGRWRLF